MTRIDPFAALAAARAQRDEARAHILAVLTAIDDAHDLLDETWKDGHVCIITLGTQCIYCKSIKQIHDLLERAAYPALEAVNTLEEDKME